MSSPRQTLTALIAGFLLLPSTAVFAAGKCDRLIVTGSPDAPPYLWRDPQDPKHLMGANADLLKEAATQMGVKVEFLFGGKRSQALEEVRTGRMDLLADTPLNSAELESLDFIHPPIAQNEIMVWTRVGHAQPFNALADLRGHPGAISEKTRITSSFDSSIKEHLTLEKQPNLTQAFQKLMLGQVEFVLAGRYAGLALTQTLGMAKDLQAQPLPLDRPGLYLALSFNSACNDPWLRGQLAKKMTELAASGRSSEAVTRNLELWKAQLQQPASTTNQ
ncbi:MAG: transporter substrate-binding domain-containing protein [Pseudomonas sp.]|jgi:polar amino acid transport system substrate-binding protein|uniref:substrate-binding periplasmic protein n=1 Tax=Pseudomonas sp. TaxID=306 RepID=UPI00239E4CF9|nr:transporter substrate-binding domain-containing protein [Pseudomonas sp.]MDE1199046.1 transporter substrate-binding domain-containing protein [Pseudomonas sp.]